MTVFKNSTALILAMSLMVPHAAISQQAMDELDKLPDEARATMEACVAQSGDTAACLEEALKADTEQATEAETTAEQDKAAKKAEKQQKKAEKAAKKAEKAAAAEANANAEAEVTAAPEAEAAPEANDGPKFVEAPETPAEAEPAQNEAAAPEAAPADQNTAQTEPAPAPAEAEAKTAAEAEAQATDTAPKAKLTKEERQALKREKRAEAKAALEQSLAAETEGDAPAAAALVDAENTEMTATATEETITEDTARTSNEDFKTRVSDSSDKEEADDKGLTTVEKAALAGLAALAVGAVLKNGAQVAANSGDRVVLEQPDGTYRVIKDDGALLRQPGTTVRTQSYEDGSSRTISTREDGSQIITIYDSQKRIVRRERIDANGDRYVLVDDSQGAAPVEVTALPAADINDSVTVTNQDALRAALEQQARTDRSFTLNQIRQISQVRALAPAIAVENVTFATGSAAIRPEQAESLAALGDTIRDRIAENPREIFLVEGHTDAVGNAAYNLALSDRRAESLALALTEYFNVPAENLIVQGYGEEYLKVATQTAEEANRRANVRRITDLLRTASAN
ncbi:OmpA family protein [Donghicola sp. C2-DW-16]|uniref:OmpA family protein n=1 Tax=Donghicola mangrovi TaxID=2729614 RepID=A0ABX2PDY8_9RHOB|nr:OmpA family protein [Donghicola mangrovi]NVO27232.1 OmpA family protein [Donghicola mangrovi]